MRNLVEHIIDIMKYPHHTMHVQLYYSQPKHSVKSTNQSQDYNHLPDIALVHHWTSSDLSGHVDLWEYPVLHGTGTLAVDPLGLVGWVLRFGQVSMASHWIWLSGLWRPGQNFVAQASAKWRRCSGGSVVSLLSVRWVTLPWGGFLYSQSYIFPAGTFSLQ